MNLPTCIKSRWIRRLPLCQKCLETFKNYTLSVQSLIRHSGYTDDQQLERIFQNTLPEYQWYIRRRDFLSLEGLLEMAEDIPTLPPWSGEHHRRVSPNEEPDEPRINVKTACRRCGQEGHFADRCQGKVLLFCWVCGRRNLRAIHCCRLRTGNEDRDRIERGGTGPQQTTPLH